MRDFSKSVFVPILFVTTLQTIDTMLYQEKQGVLREIAIPMHNRNVRPNLRNNRFCSQLCFFPSFIRILGLKCSLVKKN